MTLQFVIFNVFSQIFTFCRHTTTKITFNFSGTFFANRFLFSPHLMQFIKTKQNKTKLNDDRKKKRRNYFLSTLADAIDVLMIQWLWKKPVNYFSSIWRGAVDYYCLGPAGCSWIRIERLLKLTVSMTGISIACHILELNMNRLLVHTSYVYRQFSISLYFIFLLKIPNKLVVWKYKEHCRPKMFSCSVNILGFMHKLRCLQWLPAVNILTLSKGRNDDFFFY